jgi:hypothetical protein
MGYVNSYNASILISKRSFQYEEGNDILTLDGFTLYRQGKWAKKIEASVTFDSVDAKGFGKNGGWYLTVTFKLNHVDPNPPLKDTLERWAQSEMTESLTKLIDNK